MDLAKLILSAPFALINIAQFIYLGMRAREERDICSGREWSVSNSNINNNNPNKSNN